MMAANRLFAAVALGLLCAAIPSAAISRDRIKAPQGSAKIDNLLQCRKLADPARRLDCYDSNIPQLEAALAKKDLYVVDRSKAEEATRSAFGYSVPGIGAMFGMGEVDKIESTVVSSGFQGAGGVTVTLADGSRWSQQDDKEIWGSIKPGTAVTVVRGLMGSYVVRIKGQVGFKAIRIG